MSKRRLLILYDWYYAKGYDGGWYLPAWCERDYSVHVRGYRRPLRVGMRFRRAVAWLEYVRLTFRALLSRQRYDALVFWAWPTGVLVALVVRLLRMQCARIVILNLIIYQKAAIRASLERLVLSYALGRVDVVTCAARGLVDKYRTDLGYTGKMCFLPDPFDGDDSARGELGDYVFSGGMSLRDWPTLIEAARRLDEEQFILCAASSDRALNGLSIPHNVTVEYDVSYDRFYQLLADSRLVVLPLADAEATSGLLVLLRAFNYQKAVVTTRTVCTVDYIEHGENGLLVDHRDEDDLVEKIRLLSGDLELTRKLGTNAKNSLQRFSWEAYYQRFRRILEGVLDEEGQTEDQSRTGPNGSAWSTSEEADR